MRERRLAIAVIVAVACVLGFLALPKVKRLFGKHAPPPRLVPLEGAESAILPKRTYEARGAAAMQVTRETLAVSRASGSRPATRRYVLVAPKQVDTSRKYAVVLVLHGDGGTGETFHDGFPFERASGDEAILAYPDAPSGWDLETTKGNADVAFLATLVDELAGRFPVDRERVYAAGYSRGGFFANVMACQRPGFFRAISSSAGGAPYGQAEQWPNGFAKCPGQAPTAMIALHGRLDFGVTFDSGRFSAEYWAYVNGCKADEIEPTGYSQCTAWRGCPPGKAVVLCDVAELSHWVWDRAAEASWTFFLSQSDATR